MKDRAVVRLKRGEGRTLKGGGAWIYDNEIERPNKIPHPLKHFYHNIIQKILYISVIIQQFPVSTGIDLPFITIIQTVRQWRFIFLQMKDIYL